MDNKWVFTAIAITLFKPIKLSFTVRELQVKTQIF